MAMEPKQPNEFAQPVHPDTNKWITEIHQRIAKCSSMRELHGLATNFSHFRYSPDVVRQCIEPLRSRAVEICSDIVSHSYMVIDLPAIYHAAFSASEGTSHVIQETRSRMARLYKLHRPTWCIIGIDSKHSWRKVFFQGYKAKRPPKERNFMPLLDETLAALRAKNAWIEECHGYESDDVMCSVAYRCKILNQACILVTDDRDLWQCLGHKTVIQPIRDPALRDEAWLKAQHHITPKQVVDWLCLVGKDDVPSAYGIGEETASQWLEMHGDFLEIYDRRESMTPAKRKAIEDFAPNYLLARNLHTLSRSISLGDSI